MSWACDSNPDLTCFSKATQFRLTPICINTKECPCSQFSHTLTSSYTHEQPPPAQTHTSRPILSHAWGLSATFSMAPSLQQGQRQAVSPHSQVSALTLPPPLPHSEHTFLLLQPDNQPQGEAWEKARHSGGQTAGPTLGCLSQFYSLDLAW